MDISFLLPSKDRSKAAFVIDIINQIGDVSERSYEICLYADFIVDKPYVDCFKDVGKGPLYGFNLLAQQSKGDVVACLVDDHVPSYNIFGIINFLNSLLFSDKVPQVTTLRSGSPCWVPRLPLPNNKSLLKDSRVLMYRWPALTRRSLEEYFDGFIFHPDFTYHWADNWLGFYINAMDWPQIEASHIKLYEIPSPSNNYNSTHDDEDYDTFRKLVDKFNDGYRKYT